MNRFELAIFIVGVGALSLSGCSQPQPEPIFDDSIYVGGKIGTTIVTSVRRVSILECENTRGKFYMEGHEILCYESESDPRPDLEPDRDGKPATDKKNNGWGNGDQDAPGGSEFKNGAENKGGNRDGSSEFPGK